MKRLGHKGLAALAATVATAAALVVVAPAGQASQAADPVTDWVADTAVPLRTVDPSAHLNDLAPLRRAVGDARIVGLGEAVHSTAEQTTLKHRTMRYLVEKLGFRRIAWEDDWSLGVQLDEYIRTGRGDLTALQREMSGAWRSREVAAIFTWLRDFNARHPHDQVRFAGVEYYSTRPAAYDHVKRYVATAAPGRYAELAGHLNPITPDRPMGEYVGWFWNYDGDKQVYIDHAKAALAVVEGIRHRPGDRRHELAVHTARQFVYFYEHFTLTDNWAYRDAHAAQNLRWWQRYAGGRVVYWAAGSHTANAPGLRYESPAGTAATWDSVGSFLRNWYGDRYLSIGFTFDHGSTIDGRTGRLIEMPAPAPDWYERQFATVGHDQFLLDLRGRTPRPVAEWLRAPAKTRGVPEGGHNSWWTGGSVAQWFDLIVHRQTVTPVTPLG